MTHGVCGPNSRSIPRHTFPKRKLYFAKGRVVACFTKRPCAYALPAPLPAAEGYLPCSFSSQGGYLIYIAGGSAGQLCCPRCLWGPVQCTAAYHCRLTIYRLTIASLCNLFTAATKFAGPHQSQLWSSRRVTHSIHMSDGFRVHICKACIVRK